MYNKKMILLSVAIFCISFFMVYLAYKSYNTPSGYMMGPDGISYYSAHVMVESFEKDGLHNYPQTAELYEMYKKDAIKAKKKMFLFAAASVLCMLSAGYIFFSRKKAK